MVEGPLDEQMVWVMVSRHVTVRTDCADGLVHSLSFDEEVEEEHVVVPLLAV